MNTSARSVFNLGLVLLPIGGVIFFALRQQSIARLRVEHETLWMESSEAGRLTVENQQMDQLRADLRGVDQLREENRDLPKLRNEVTQLRKEKAQLASLRAEHERLLAQTKAAPTTNEPGSASPPANFIPRASLLDVGFGSPEATVQTAFWAISHGNSARFVQCLAHRDSNSGPQFYFMGHWSDWNQPNEIPKSLADQVSRFAGYGIAEKKMISPIEVVLGMQSSAGGAVMPLKLRLVGAEWKLEQN